jgi:putative flippase GtrA
MAKEAIRFLLVGSLGYLIDVAIFNTLMIIPKFSEQLGGPIAPKAVATLCAIAFTYWANSSWTFKIRNGTEKNIRQFGLYFLVNIAGLLIILFSLFISHYVLGFTSLLADNISANVVGVGFATVFRFVANRYWVFPDSDRQSNKSPLGSD